MFLIDILKQSIVIATFVMITMLLIEYINVKSKGTWAKYMQRSGWLQLLTCGILGVMPGCLGSYVVVSLYSHSIVSFGALVTALLANFGDEAYVMFSLYPAVTLKLTFLILALALVVGMLVDFFFKPHFIPADNKTHLVLHQDEMDQHSYQTESIIKQIRNISFQRAVLIFGLILFVLAVSTGTIGEDTMPGATGHWNWVNITFLIVTLMALFVVIDVPDHFLEEHLWKHIIKKHFLKIFLWTFGALLIIQILLHYLNLGAWVKSNELTILFISLLVGIIPESGPNLIFVTMFANGVIPFSILFANSIVQDGHAGLPMLAESKKSWLAAKAINLAIGIAIGLIGHFMGW